MGTKSPPQVVTKGRKVVQHMPQTISNVNLHMNFFNLNSKPPRGTSAEKSVVRPTEKRPRSSAANAFSVSRSDAFLQKRTQAQNKAFSRSQEKSDAGKARRSSQKISEPKFLRSKCEFSASTSINVGNFLAAPSEFAANFAAFAKKEAKRWGRVEDVVSALKASLASNPKQVATVLEQLAISAKRAKKGAKKIAVKAEKASEAIEEDARQHNRPELKETNHEFFVSELSLEPPPRPFSRKEEPIAVSVAEPASPPRKKRQTVFNLARPSAPPTPPPPLPPPDPKADQSNLSNKSKKIANEKWKTPSKANPNALSQLLDCRNGSISMRESRRNLSEVSRQHYSMFSQNLGSQEQEALPLTTSAILHQDPAFESRSLAEPHADSNTKPNHEKPSFLAAGSLDLSAVKSRHPETERLEHSGEKNSELLKLVTPSSGAKDSTVDFIAAFVEIIIFDSLAMDPLFAKLLKPPAGSCSNAILIRDDGRPNDSCEVAYAIRTHHVAIREYLGLLQKAFADLAPHSEQPDFRARSVSEFEAHEKQLMVI